MQNAKCIMHNESTQEMFAVEKQMFFVEMTKIGTRFVT